MPSCTPLPRGPSSSTPTPNQQTYPNTTKLYSVPSIHIYPSSSCIVVASSRWSRTHTAEGISRASLPPAQHCTCTVAPAQLHPTPPPASALPPPAAGRPQRRTRPTPPHGEEIREVSDCVWMG